MMTNQTFLTFNEIIEFLEIRYTQNHEYSKDIVSVIYESFDANTESLYNFYIKLNEQSYTYLYIFLL